MIFGVLISIAGHHGDKDAHALKLMPGAVIHLLSHHCL